MACNNYQNCVNRERQNMRYPIDMKSLYASRYYDDHAAKTRCYANNPINILEGFGGPMTLEKLLKWILVALLVALLVMFAKDFFMPKEEIPILIAEESDIRMTPMTALQQ